MAPPSALRSRPGGRPRMNLVGHLGPRSMTGLGPSRTLLHGEGRGSCMPVLVRLVDCGSPSPCRVPPRRAGNFLLVAQKKVTKEEGLKTNTPHSFCALRTPGPAGYLTPRDTSNLPLTGRYGSLRIAGTPDCRESGPRAKRSEPVTCERAAASIHLAVSSSPLGRASEAGWTNGWFCVQALFFGDFLLGHQKKVTRPPGRNPAA